VNIRNHVPVLLDLLDSNYSQWRCLLESVLGKFGLLGHVRSPPPLADRDAEWRQVDYSIVNWLYTTVNQGVFDLIYKPDASAFTIWSDIEGLFRDNEMHCAFILEADFRSVVQGDLSIDAYCTKLKKLSDKLRDVGHPVSEPSQVLNLLRGLNPKYRYVKPVLTSKPHTFMSARSYLLLEEIQLQHDDNTAAGQAFLANHGGSAGSVAPAAHGGSSGSAGSSSGASGASNPDAGGNRGSKPKNKRRGRAPSAGSSSSGNTSAAPQRPQVPWTANYNP